MRIHNIFSRIALLLFATALLISGCKDTEDTDSIIPNGSYTDNYGASHTFSETEWTDSWGNTFAVVKKNRSSDYVIYQNDAGNAYNPSKFSRVDFTEDSNENLYYCQIAYDKDTADEAEAVTTADRNDLDGGCNGFAWSQLTETTE